MNLHEQLNNLDPCSAWTADRRAGSVGQQSVAVHKQEERVALELRREKLECEDLASRLAAEAAVWAYFQTKQTVTLRRRSSTSSSSSG